RAWCARPFTGRPDALGMGRATCPCAAAVAGASARMASRARPRAAGLSMPKSIRHAVISIRFRRAHAALLLIPIFVALPAAQRAASPPDAGVDVARLAEIPALVGTALAHQKDPAALVL